MKSARISVPPRRHQVLYSSHTETMRHGGQISLFHLAKRIDRSHFRPFLVCPGPGEISAAFKRIGIQSMFMAFPRVHARHLLQFPFCLVKAGRILWRYNIDLVHTDHPIDTSYLAACCRILSIPIIWHARVSEHSRLDRFNAAMVDRIICVSDAVSRRFHPYSRAKGKVVTIHNGVDCHTFRPLNREDETIPPIATPAKKRIVTACRLEESKGIFDLLDAAKLLNNRRDDFQFIIAGEGDNAIVDRALRWITENGLSGKVELIGYRRHIEQLLRVSDVFVLASHREGFPRTVIEAMACGLPVVATDVGGVSEAVVDGHTGILVPANRPTELCLAIETLLEDPERSRMCGIEGRRRVEKHFSIEANVTRIQNVYQELIGPYSVS